MRHIDRAVATKSASLLPISSVVLYRSVVSMDFTGWVASPFSGENGDSSKHSVRD
jgi:hypothetical protein